MKVSDIISRVTLLYNDMDYVRLSKHQYLEFLDDAINKLIMMRPDVWVKTDVVKLNPGIRQTIPDDAYALTSIVTLQRKRITPLRLVSLCFR